MKRTFRKIGLFFKKVKVMLQAETPRFFRNLFHVLLSIFALAEFVYPGLVEYVNRLTVLQISVPGWISEAVRIVGAVAAGGAIVSQLVVKWPELTQHQQDILDRKA